MVHGIKNDREGCATLQVHSPLWNRLDDHQARFDQQLTWASLPLSPGSVREVRLRTGEYRLEQITSDYGMYPQLGLRYFLRATYNTQNNHLLLSIQNKDLQTGNPSGVFLTPLYDRYMNRSSQVFCRASSDFSNEFFVSNTASEVEIALDSNPRQANLCEPCAEGVSRISFEIQ